jgi:hypothetical protein
MHSGPSRILSRSDQENSGAAFNRGISRAFNPTTTFRSAGHLFDLPFSMRLISKVIPVLNPSHHFQRFIHVERSQGQNYLQGKGI